MILAVMLTCNLSVEMQLNNSPHDTRCLGLVSVWSMVNLTRKFMIYSQEPYQTKLQGVGYYMHDHY